MTTRTANPTGVECSTVITYNLNGNQYQVVLYAEMNGASNGHDFMVRPLDSDYIPRREFRHVEFDDDADTWVVPLPQWVQDRIELIEAQQDARPDQTQDEAHAAASENAAQEN